MAYSVYTKNEPATEHPGGGYYERFSGAAFDYNEEVGQAIAEEIRLSIGRRNVHAYAIDDDECFDIHREEPARSHMRSTVCMDHHIQARMEREQQEEEEFQPYQHQPRDGSGGRRNLMPLPPPLQHRALVEALGRRSNQRFSQPMDRRVGSPHGVTAVPPPPSPGAAIQYSQSPSQPRGSPYGEKNDIRLPPITMRRQR